MLSDLKLAALRHLRDLGPVSADARLKGNPFQNWFFSPHWYLQSFPFEEVRSIYDTVVHRHTSVHNFVIEELADQGYVKIFKRDRLRTQAVITGFGLGVLESLERSEWKQTESQFYEWAIKGYGAQFKPRIKIGITPGGRPYRAIVYKKANGSVFKTVKVWTGSSQWYERHTRTFGPVDHEQWNKSRFCFYANRNKWYDRDWSTSEFTGFAWQGVNYTAQPKPVWGIHHRPRTFKALMKPRRTSDEYPSNWVNVILRNKHKVNHELATA